MSSRGKREENKEASQFGKPQLLECEGLEEVWDRADWGSRCKDGSNEMKGLGQK